LNIFCVLILCSGLSKAKRKDKKNLINYKSNQHESFKLHVVHVNLSLISKTILDQS